MCAIQTQSDRLLAQNEIELHIYARVAPFVDSARTWFFLSLLHPPLLVFGGLGSTLDVEDNEGQAPQELQALPRPILFTTLSRHVVPRSVTDAT